MYNSGNVNEAYTLFSDKLSTIYDDYIPLVTSTIKRNPNKPWLTQEILVVGSIYGWTPKIDTKGFFM